jgi:hypothetical protein
MLDLKRMVERSLWAMWYLMFGAAAFWLLAGSVGYWVKYGWLPKDTSGWVQAVGSMLAIVVAVIVPAIMKRHETRRRQISEIEAELGAYYQFRNLVQETQDLLSQPVGSRNGGYGWSREFVYDRCLNVIDRLNILSLKSFNVLFLKHIYDVRMHVMEFIKLIVPDDVSGPNDRAELVNALTEIKSHVSKMIANQTLYLDALDS